METQSLPISPTLKNTTISSGKYTFPEITGDVTLVVDPEEKVYIEGKISGKGKVVINGGIVSVNSYFGDVDVTLINCWIMAPFVNQASSLLLRNCTLLFDDQSTYFIHNKGLKLTIEQSKFIFTGTLSHDLTLIKNEGELINSFRANFYLHFGHNIQEKRLTFIESQRGEVEMTESSLLLTSMFREKPILVKGSNCLVKLKRFGLGSEQEFLSTMVEDCQVSFEECYFNGKPIRELMDRQEVSGDYSSHMSGKIYVVYAREVLVDTRKAPVQLQLPLHARHNETILIQKRFPSAFAVKIKIGKEKKEFVMGQGGSQGLYYLLLRYSSKGWIEKERGEGEYKEKKTHALKSQDNTNTLEEKQKEEKLPKKEKKSSSLTRSKYIRAKFNRGRELRKELLKS